MQESGRAGRDGERAESWIFAANRELECQLTGEVKMDEQAMRRYIKSTEHRKARLSTYLYSGNRVCSSGSEHCDNCECNLG